LKNYQMLPEEFVLQRNIGKAMSQVL